MGRRGRSLYKRRYKKRRIRERDNSSDDSDEEYILGEDESDDSRDSPDDSCSSPANFSEESFDFREASTDGSDEEQKVLRSKPRKRISARKRPGVKRSGRRARVLDDVDDDDDDDEEFNPDVDDGVDDDDEFLTVRKNRFRSVMPKKKRSVKSIKRKQKSKVSKRTASERRGRLVLRRSVSSDDDFVVDDKVERKKKKKKKGKKKKVKRRNRRSIMHSESEFVDSESSDFDYTVSAEERDPLKELRSRGRRLGNLTTCSRSSSLSKRLQVEGGWKVQQERTVRRKGKEKVNDLNVDTAKQLCGICLSEERKGIVRGTLNSCAHYFCYTCIMEWSKVESRCPVCKQRFTTISKPTRLGVGVGLRNSVIRIPKRDQVYQPSEEELRVYVDPYENVICMECQQGGDDDLMLLCDICDSPAHTYCVGLGREVPEGNWYCEGCASSDLGSSNSQVHDPVLDQGTNNSGLCYENPTGGIDVENLDTIFPEQSFPCSNYMPASPRYPLGEDRQAASPISGAGAPTISGRRRLRRQIQTLLFNNRMSPIPEMSDRNDELPHPNLESGVISEVEQAGETAGHARASDNGGSNSAAVEVRKREPNKPSAILESSSSVQNRAPFCSRLSISRRQGIQGPSIPSITSSPAELEQINPSDAVLRHEQPNLCSRPVTGSNASISWCNYSEGSSFRTAEDAKEQVRSLVKRHLKRLSRDTVLERSTFKTIARNSTHTILAVCGVEHSKRMATPVQPPSKCSHIDKGEPSLLKGCCSSCFDTFIKDVVLRCMNAALESVRFGG